MASHAKTCTCVCLASSHISCKNDDAQISSTDGQDVHGVEPGRVTGCVEYDSILIQRSPCFSSSRPRTTPAQPLAETVVASTAGLYREPARFFIKWKGTTGRHAGMSSNCVRCYGRVLRRAWAEKGLDQRRSRRTSSCQMSKRRIWPPSAPEHS